MLLSLATAGPRIGGGDRRHRSRQARPDGRSLGPLYRPVVERGRAYLRLVIGRPPFVTGGVASAFCIGRGSSRRNRKARARSPWKKRSGRRGARTLLEFGPPHRPTPLRTFYKVARDGAPLTGSPHAATAATLKADGHAIPGNVWSCRPMLSGYESLRAGDGYPVSSSIQPSSSRRSARVISPMCAMRKVLSLSLP